MTLITYIFSENFRKKLCCKVNNVGTHKHKKMNLVYLVFTFATSPVRLITLKSDQDPAYFEKSHPALKYIIPDPNHVVFLCGEEVVYGMLPCTYPFAWW